MTLPHLVLRQFSIVYICFKTFQNLNKNCPLVCVIICYTVYDRLKARYFGYISLGYIHGRLGLNDFFFFWDQRIIRLSLSSHYSSIQIEPTYVHTKIFSIRFTETEALRMLVERRFLLKYCETLLIFFLYM